MAGERRTRQVSARLNEDVFRRARTKLLIEDDQSWQALIDTAVTSYLDGTWTPWPASGDEGEVSS